MKKDKLIEKLEKLALACESDNIEVAAMLYSIIASIQTNNEKILSDKVQILTRSIIYPDMDAAIKAKDAIKNIKDDLNLN